MGPEYLTADEVAAQLRLNPKTVRRMLADGRVPRRKLGKKWRTSARALEKLIEGRRMRDEVQPSVRRTVSAGRKR